jgi:tRNA pseudouridine32 synthase/23S rRNA pseudouridine746 synthase/23S rRNA pseudouridine955/2504/2580 synthase
VIAVLWSGDGLVAVDKPAGLPVIPGRSETGGPPLRAQLEAQLGRRVWVVHRLDRDTSGVLLFALDAASHRAASLAFEGGLAEKWYLALVSPPLPAAVRVDAPLMPARRARMRVARPGEAGKPAVTELAPVATSGEVGLVEARPLTGRTHQIRVHLRHAGAPLLIDPQYGRPAPVTERDLGGGSDAVVLSRTPLHAARLVLPAGQGLPALDVRAPLPPDMARAVELLQISGRGRAATFRSD